MSPRSEERTEFLGDILTTAVEGGTGYWAQVSQYQWVDSDGSVRVHSGPRTGEGARAVLHRLNDDESGYVDEGLVIDIDVIAAGLAKIAAPGFSINEKLRQEIAYANRHNDAGEIDADHADVIVQAALFGEIVYG
jgi:hypothetical protein